MHSKACSKPTKTRARIKNTARKQPKSPLPVRTSRSRSRRCRNRSPPFRSAQRTRRRRIKSLHPSKKTPRSCRPNPLSRNKVATSNKRSRWSKTAAPSRGKAKMSSQPARIKASRKKIWKLKTSPLQNKLKRKNKKTQKAPKKRQIKIKRPSLPRKKASLAAKSRLKSPNKSKQKKYQTTHKKKRASLIKTTISQTLSDHNWIAPLAFRSLSLINHFPKNWCPTNKMKPVPKYRRCAPSCPPGCWK